MYYSAGGVNMTLRGALGRSIKGAGGLNALARHSGIAV